MPYLKHPIAVALHEAAHAVIGEKQAVRVKSASIVPDENDETLGRVRWERAGGLSRAHIAALLAGDLAQPEAGVDNNYLPLYYGQRDEEMARDMALELAEREGSGFSGASKNFDDGRATADALVKRHRAVIDHVAGVLLERRTINGDELRRAMQMRPAWYLHDDHPTVPTRTTARTRGAVSDHKPAAADWRDDGAGGFVATRTFTARIGGEVYEITAERDRVAEGHALVAGLRAPRRQTEKMEEAGLATLLHLTGSQRASLR